MQMFIYSIDADSASGNIKNHVSTSTKFSTWTMRGFHRTGTRTIFLTECTPLLLARFVFISVCMPLSLLAKEYMWSQALWEVNNMTEDVLLNDLAFNYWCMIFNDIVYNWQDFLGQFECSLGEVVSSGTTDKPLRAKGSTQNCGSIIGTSCVGFCCVILTCVVDMSCAVCCIILIPAVSIQNC